MKLNELDTVCIVGLGLLGGSVGMAVNRALGRVRRVGYSHRAVTRRRAVELGTVDMVCADLADAVGRAQFVILAVPVGTFPDLMRQMAEYLPDHCIVTDVGSTKALPARWARKFLPARVEFLGSHPMAGSEQRGVEFARDDLFDGANCIVTPTARTSRATLRFVGDFWRTLGMRVSHLGPAEHDRVLARISHLPHVLATALVNCSDEQQIALCGKGFLDTTRIASGPPGVWRDILMTNTTNSAAAIGRLIKELTRLQKALHTGNEKAIMRMLETAQKKRNNLVAEKLKRRELPG